MNNWTQTPSKGATHNAVQLVRIKPERPLSGIITSKRLIGKYVHYWRGRTTPCTDQECPACEDNRIARWYGWISLWGPKSKQHVILEVTASCTEEIEEYYHAHGQLRGAQIHIERPGYKVNGRLHVRLSESLCSPDVLPAALDVATILEHIWETHHGQPQHAANKDEKTNGKLHLA
jgi:hypothetical protein